MASNLLAVASNLEGMTSNLLAMASNLIAMAACAGCGVRASEHASWLDERSTCWN